MAVTGTGARRSAHSDWETAALPAVGPLCLQVSNMLKDYNTSYSSVKTRRDSRDPSGLGYSPGCERSNERNGRVSHQEGGRSRLTPDPTLHQRSTQTGIAISTVTSLQ